MRHDFFAQNASRQVAEFRMILCLRVPPSVIDQFHSTLFRHILPAFLHRGNRPSASQDEPKPVCISAPQPACLPFDGTCRCSRDGDVTLAFADGSFLKTQSKLLQLASPTFGAMMTGSYHSRRIHMERTSRETWVRILNFLHPSAPPFEWDINPYEETDLIVKTRTLRQD